jgi:UDP-MurNAc hydroxylase
MKLTHLQSSSQIIHLGDIKVLTDPWLTDGEYYGSWYHYPPFGEKNLESLEYDYIYVSHIHPDHLSEKTFKALPQKKPVLVHNYDSKFVKRKLEMLGFEVIECDNGIPYIFGNGGSITIYAADNCNPEICGKFMGCGVVEKKFGSTQIDSLALFEMGKNSILNTNDCPYELASHTIKANKLNEKKIDLLLVGYAGAGPYPQCFEFDNEEDKVKAAKAKEQQFLKQAVNYIHLVRPACFAPFAGTYTLGSRLASLTDYRGVPSVSYATQFLNDAVADVSNGIHLEKFDSYDCESKEFTKSDNPFALTKDQYRKEISNKPLDYDNDSWDDAELGDLIETAYKRFKSKAEKIEFNSNTKLVIRSNKVAFQLSTNHTAEIIPVDSELIEPFVRIDVNHNLLHRLLRGPRYAHWDNAEIGSHLKYLRKPNTFERGLYHCMCFLHK